MAWLYREPGRYDCGSCANAPQLLELNGNCGGEAPGRLPLLLGDVSRCPTAMGLEDPEVLELAELVPGPFSNGLLDESSSLLAFPPRYRAALALARAWLVTWKGQQVSRDEHE